MCDNMVQYHASWSDTVGDTMTWHDIYMWEGMAL